MPCFSGVIHKETLKTEINVENDYSISPLETGRKLKVHKTFRKHPGRLLDVLYTFNLVLCPRGDV